MKLPICEMFVSTQMEGSLSGIPSIFLRVSGCNLRCCFKNSRCDTPYASFNPETSKYNSIEDLVKAFKDLRKQYPKVKDLVITGGEPLLYADAIDEFLSKVFTSDLIVTIETNGTLPPLKSNYVSLYSISPKLSTSMCKETSDILTPSQIEHHNNTRINIPNLVKLVVDKFTEFQLKFVYSGEECIAEIEEIINNIANTQEIMTPESCLEYINDCVMLMPEGMDDETLQKSRQECVAKCIEKGWRYTDRLHIIVWGNKRGV